MKEIYKDILEYEGLYQISNLGNVRSFHQYRYDEKQKKIIHYWSPIKSRVSGVNGNQYLAVRLTKNKIFLNHRVHRLVASVFCKKTEGYNVVNHIDGNKLNNNSENLEWCTSSYNTIHAFNTGLRIPTGKYGKHPRSKKIERIDRVTGEIKKYDSMKRAADELNVDYANISACISGRAKTAYNYEWRLG